MGGAPLSDNTPDCELNRVDVVQQNFGFPFCQSGGSGDPVSRTPGVSQYLIYPDFNAGGTVFNCSRSIKAIQPLGPHVAPLGMRFYDPNKGRMFPSTYHNVIFIGEHGSWNRNPKIGYRVSWVKLNPSSLVPIARGLLVDGFLSSNQGVSGRPVDVEQLPDGSLLISDDYGSGTVWRVTYSAVSTANSSAEGAVEEAGVTAGATVESPGDGAGDAGDGAAPEVLVPGAVNETVTQPLSKSGGGAVVTPGAAATSPAVAPAVTSP